MSRTKGKKPEIVFMPGCFDHLDLTQDELDTLVKDLTQAAESGELFEGNEITEEEFNLLPEEIKEQILAAEEFLNNDHDPNSGRTLH